MKNYLDHLIDLKGLAKIYDELPLWSAPFGLKLLDYIKYRPGLTALDIGFGTGFPLTEVAMRLGSDAVVYGIDPWEDAHEAVKAKLKYYKISNAKLIKGYAESIPLNNRSVDLIVSNNGINNVKDQDKVFSECARVIRPGGQLVFTMNLDKSMIEFYSVFGQVLSEAGLEEELAAMKQHIYVKRRPLDEILNSVTAHGFHIKDMEHDQFNYRFASGTAMLNHYFIRMAFMESWVKLLPAGQVESVFDKIEARLNEEAGLLGETTLSIPYVLINAILGE
ncbi:MAG: class I SAM-dependent methyltransferase [Bacteroidales bacterium]